MKFRLAIGADHRGFELKKALMIHRQFNAQSIEWIDVGTFSSERTDYPPFAKKVAEHILNKKADAGILLCGSGIGVAIAANRYKGIYAGVAWNEKVAQLAKEDDNVNILVLPADLVTYEEAQGILQAWLSSSFKEGRYQERLKMIDEQS